MQLNYANTMLKVKILQQGQQISFLEAVARWQGGVIRGQENRIGQLQGQVKGLQNQVASLQYTIYQLKHRPSGGGGGSTGGGGGGMGPKGGGSGGGFSLGVWGACPAGMSCYGSAGGFPCGVLRPICDEVECSYHNATTVAGRKCTHSPGQEPVAEAMQAATEFVGGYIKAAVGGCAVVLFGSGPAYDASATGPVGGPAAGAACGTGAIGGVTSHTCDLVYIIRFAHHG